MAQSNAFSSIWSGKAEIEMCIRDRITCQYGFVASGARKDRKFDSGLGGGALLDIGIYNLGFLRILTGPVSYTHLA